MALEGFVKQYLDDLGSLLPRLDTQAIAQAIVWLREACDQGRMIYICGNGGSASIASQMVVDIVKGASTDREPRFKMLGLTDSISTITAYGNDLSYDDVFVEPLKNFAQADDVLIAISGSGNSQNVLRAVDHANQTGCKTIGVTSSEGGRLKDAAQLTLGVPSNHMGRLEDLFFVMTHILCYAFIEKAA